MVAPEDDRRGGAPEDDRRGSNLCLSMTEGGLMMTSKRSGCAEDDRRRGRSRMTVEGGCARG